MKKRTLACLSSAFFMTTLTAPLYGQAPPGFDAIPVHLKFNPVFETPQYDYTENVAAIQQLATDSEHSIHESLTLGLTQYKPYMEFSVPIRSITNTVTGTTCLRLEDSEVTFGYKDVVVYIANEITPQSCGFNMIYEHEQKHIAVNWELLQEYAPVIQTTLQDYLNKFGLICTQNSDQVQQDINEAFHQLLVKWGEQISTENQHRQHDVDRPEEYKRISDSCDGQLQIIGRQFLAQHH